MQLASLIEQIIEELKDKKRSIIKIPNNSKCKLVILNEAPYYSLIDTDNSFTIHLESFWRVIEKNRVIFTISDDKQKFGLKKPFDVLEAFNEEFDGVELLDIEIKRPISDISFNFKNEKRIEVFVDSSGYEGWSMGGNKRQIICLGGGDIAIF